MVARRCDSVDRRPPLRGACARQREVIALYITGFVVEIAGIVLLVLDVSRDIADGNRLRIRREQNQPAGIHIERPGVTVDLVGFAAEQMARSRASADALETLTIERLSGSLVRRWVAVGLVVSGAVIGLVADIASL